MLRSSASDLNDIKILQTLYFNEHIIIIENNFFYFVKFFYHITNFLKKQPFSKKPINKQYWEHTRTSISHLAAKSCIFAQLFYIKCAKIVSL